MSTVAEGHTGLDGKLTRSNRFVSRCSLTNPLIFPFGIHSDTITNSVSVIDTPMSGSTFGCRRAFHNTNSLQKLWKVMVRMSMIARETVHYPQPTWEVACTSLEAEVRSTFTATSRPLWLYFSTFADLPRCSITSV